MASGGEASTEALSGSIRELAEDTPYAVHTTESHVSLTVPGSPISTIFEVVDAEHFALYFYCRTSSHDWIGERTDLHDIASLFFAAVLRGLSGVTGRLVNVLNPAIEIPGELYGRYILPLQPAYGAIPISDIAARTDVIMAAAWQAQSLMHGAGLFAHGTAHQGFTRESPDLQAWQSDLINVLVLEDDLPSDALFYKRTNPDWRYFRSEELGMSVVDSVELSRILSRLCSLDQKSTTELSSVEGRLQLRAGAKTVIPFSSEAGIAPILADLEAASNPALLDPTPVSLLALEDCLISVTGSHFIAMDDETGRLASEVEQERLLARHTREAEFLFASTTYQWRHPIDAARFEDLIVELLNREAGVLLAKKSGSTYDRDAGRDIIIERVLGRVAEHSGLSKDESPWERLRMVGQCKTTRDGRSVPFSKIQGILDTVEAHQARGYFLAVSSELTGSAVQRLEAFRTRGTHHIEWWTRIEIEQRVRRNRDIAARYKDIVTPDGV